MGVAKERALQIQEQREQEAASKQEAVRVGLTISNKAPDLWETLCAALAAETKEFADSLSEAKHLRSDRFNSNNLTVQTTVFPMIKVEIIRGSDGYIRSRVTETKHGLGETRVRESKPIGFTVDHQNAPCFSYGERPMQPQELAEELMEPVFSFFG
jgi:hypothetical protein